MKTTAVTRAIPLLIGIAMVTLAESTTSWGELTTTHAIAFNATPSPDFDGDGIVGFSDFVAFASKFGTQRGDAAFDARFDLDGDDEIGFSDFVAFASQFGKTVESTPSGFAPPDSEAFQRLVTGKQVGNDPNNRLLFPSSGRIREIEDGTAYEGNYQYVNTGANTGTLTYTYDVTGNDPEREKVVIELTFTSATAGTFVSTYTEAGSTPQTLRGDFQLADAVNRQPVAVGVIAAQTLTVGGAAGTVDVSSSFEDPDGDALTFSAVSSDTSVAAVSALDSMVEITPKAAGSATVTVTATDPGGLSAEQTIDVAVAQPTTDVYRPLAGLRVSVGRVQYLFFSAGQCIVISNSSINNVRYTTHKSKWQRKAGTSWVDVPGTERDGLCAYSPTSAGEYRLVAEITINGVRGKYASENTLTVG